MKRALAAAVCCAIVAACAVEVPEEQRIVDQRIAGSALLIGTLGRGEPAARVAAARAMGRIQSASYGPSLVFAAAGGPAEVRAAALFALGQIALVEGPGLRQSGFVVTRRALEALAVEVRLQAIQTLGKFGDMRAAAWLEPLFEDADPRVRREVALAMFRLRYIPVRRDGRAAPPPLPETSVAALAAALSDPQAEVRQAAAYAFARYGQPEAARALIASLADDSEWVRLFAARALGHCADAAAVDPLAGLLRDPSERVRTEAVEALGRLGAAIRSVGLREDGSFHARAALARTLGEDETASTVDVLRELERDTSTTVRAAAVTALARRLGEAYVPALSAHLDDPAWSIRVSAARAAAALGPAATDVVDRARADDDVRVRVAVLEGLPADETNAPLLVAALDAADVAERATAIARFAELEHKDTVARLRAVYDASPGIEWIEAREAAIEAVAGVDGGAPVLWRAGREDPARAVRDVARRALRREGHEMPRASPDISAEPSPFLGQTFAEDPVVVLETTRGELAIRCLAREAPVHVASFVALVRRGFYDGLPWHRVVSNFVIQGGDPRGDGWGGPGYTLRDEIGEVRFERGSVGMASAGPDSGGSQLFVTHVPTPHLDGMYTLFGTVIEGLDVIDRIEVGDSIVRARVR